MKKLLVAFFALAFLAVPSAFAQDCTDELGCVEVGDDDPIVIGYMLTTSGATSFLGDDSVGGIEIAMEARGMELLGRELILVGEDSLCSAEGGQASAQRMAADPDVVGIIGTNCSSAATAALPIISEAGMVLISPSNTAPTLTDRDAGAGGVWQPGYYRTAHNDLFQGRVAAEFAYNELGARTIATVHDGSPYADGLQKVMSEVFEQLGGTVSFQGAVNVGDTDMTAILTDIASGSPDLIYYPVFQPESDFFTAQSKNISGLEDVILFGADASLVDGFPEAAGAAGVGVYLSGPYVENDRYAALLEAWDDQIGGVPPSGFHAHAHDAADMIMNAIVEVAVETDDGGLLIGRQAIRDALTNTLDYDGIIGKITCSNTGDCATGEALAVFEITQAEVDGNWPPPVAYKPGN